MAQQRRTIKHDVIKAWAEAHGGSPARVRTTTDSLRIKISDDDRMLETVAWDEWFKIFDEKELAFVFEEPGYGSKVVARNGSEDKSASH
jgi:hypothetical protein